MSPKSLSERQKENQRQFLLEKGKEVVLQYGFKKASIDDFCKAAGIAKGTFYLYFTSKEDFLIRLIADFSQNYYSLAENMILSENNKGLKHSLKDFFNRIFNLPEFLFFFREHKDMQELTNLLLQGDFAATEKAWFERLLFIGKVDMQIVSPEVVHNYLHAIYIAKTTDLMIEEYKEATIELMINNLIDYIFSGRKE